MALVAILATSVACAQGQQAPKQNEQEEASNARPKEEETSNAQTQPRDQTKANHGKKRSLDVIRVKVAGGDARASADPADVALGDKVTIAVTSDVSDEIHVHGYDKFKEVKAGQTTTISFVADIPGAFEVELEQSEIELLELRVQ